jgi:CubicO group peptidase (beta-lactamase class C family)
MKVVRIFASGLAASSVAFFAQAFNGGTFLGPIFAAPMNVSESPSLSSSLRQMTQSITKILGEKLGQDIENSVAICGFSIHDSGETPLFDYYHTGKDLSMHGTASVGPDTVFRIGSISKLFTVYLLLLQGGRNLLNEPIAKYLDIIPAYDNFNTNTNVEWGEITVGALAGQVGGILRDCKCKMCPSILPQVC